MAKQHAENAEISLSEPKVGHNIDISLNQNDLVDLVIEDQLEKLETDNDINETEIKNLLEIQKESKVSWADKMKALVAKNKDYIQYLATCKLLKVSGGDIRIEGDHYDHDTKKIGSYDYMSDNIHKFANPVANIAKESYKSELNVGSSRKFLATANAISNSGDNSKFVLNFELRQQQVPKAIIEADMKQAEEVAKKLIKAYQKRYDLAVQMLKLNHGGKRVKAAIVKQALGKSKQGKEILGMLSKASGVKLLS